MRAGVLLLVAAAACETDRRGGDTDTVPAIASAGVPLEDLVGDCPVDSAARHADPMALVEEFVRRDAEGPFEREDIAQAWRASALSCVERAASDHYEVIQGFRVAAGSRRGDTAFAYVSRDRLFELERGPGQNGASLRPAPGTWVDTVLVVRTTLGWRIHEIRGGAHRLPGVARGELRDLRSEDRRVLDSLAARPDG